MNTGTRTDTYPPEAATPPRPPGYTAPRPLEDARASGVPFTWLASPVSLKTPLRGSIAGAIYTLAARRFHGWCKHVSLRDGNGTTVGNMAADFDAAPPHPAPTSDSPTPGLAPLAPCRPAPVVVQPVRFNAPAFGYRCGAEASTRYGKTVREAPTPPAGEPYAGSVVWAVAPAGDALAVVAVAPAEEAPGPLLRVTAEGTPVVRYDQGTARIVHVNADGSPLETRGLTLGVVVAVAVVTEHGEVSVLEVRNGCGALVLDAWLDAVADAVWASRNPVRVMELASLLGNAPDGPGADAEGYMRFTHAVQGSDGAGSGVCKPELVHRLVQPATVRVAYTGRVVGGQYAALPIGTVTRTLGAIRVHLDALPLDRTITLR